MLTKPINTYKAPKLIFFLNQEYEKYDTLNIFQHSIQALVLLDQQVRNGGYIQLMQNKFGEYIFENPWSESFAHMGAARLAENLFEAKKIYFEHKDELEAETSLKEFAEMYEKYPGLDFLHQQYLSFIDDEMQIIKKFIENNFSHFESIP